ncbi:MAG TPA: fimbria/pilus periplasmic chaperone [Candidatus Dormibacteraeota bacterium]|nr:fimbria/pilus periplasmic chaperone [Candidatus Dormibacteraeota bacterium]
MFLALLLAATGFASASPALPRWHITANRLDVPAGNLAADFTIANDDRVNERFEITAYSWNQHDGAETRRVDVDDVLIFPRLLELAPGESRRIRVGVLRSDPSVESDYRIAVEQLFDPQRDRSGIHFLLAYNLPLFVAPQRSIFNARIAGVSARSRTLYVTVSNGGNVHVFVRRAVVRWRGASSAYGQPFYVLPHATMGFAAVVHRCGTGLVTIVPDKESHLAPLTASLSIPCP